MQRIQFKTNAHKSQTDKLHELNKKASSVNPLLSILPELAYPFQRPGQQSKGEFLNKEEGTKGYFGLSFLPGVS